MLKLYFGNVANFISTCLLLTFFVIFIKVIKTNPADVDWKKMSVFMFAFGILLSATGGIKDTVSSNPAITFGTLNTPFILLCILGGLATILGIIALVIRRESALQRNLFYLLSFIIVVKTVILEGQRIKQLIIK